MKETYIAESQTPLKPKKDRYRLSDSAWVASFSCSHLKILIVCRGPIRKEAMDVFTDIGAEYGILLSEKDSVTYPHTLAPELRVVKDQSRIHRVVDYAGSGDERKSRIQEIIDIARSNNYTHIFAGYGFMAEDAEFVEAIEKAGVGFIGPASGVHKAAGSKDSAKKMARELNVSVTPGIDNITALTLLQKTGGVDGLKKHAESAGLSFDFAAHSGLDAEELADKVLDAGYAAGIGLIATEEIQAEAERQLRRLFKDNPGRRFRLKYIGGGGGKGQRIVTKVEEVREAAFQVLSESKALGNADNKNFLIELNIENTRHNEIQLLGNGNWCIALGGRDCSVQMHEQKLLEISITDELYTHEMEQAEKDGREDYARILRRDRDILLAMEEQAESFGKAVGLNSASTFECIVSDDDFYFMEMNTRIQVEHRVTEMAYTLHFENPYNENEFFVVESLVEAMVLIAAHGDRLPLPVRVPNNKAGGEVRLNATDDALAPNAGGIIEHWSKPAEHEVRDDQGIGVLNPDTAQFINYNVAGAYDSNIALIVTYGSGRREMMERLSDILRQMELRGVELKTNLQFHYGLLNVILGLHPMLKPDTGFVMPYLAAVGALAGKMAAVDTGMAWEAYVRKIGSIYGAEAQSVIQPKLTFITRPLQMLLENPHLAMGWLILNHKRSFRMDDGKVIWLRNPMMVMNDLYHYLRLEDRPDTPPSMKIWDHDAEILEEALSFYSDLEKTLGIQTEKPFEESLKNSKENTSDLYQKLNASLQSPHNPFPSGEHGIKCEAVDDSLFLECQAAHRGWLLGLELLEVVIQCGHSAGSLSFSVDSELRPVFPVEFRDRNNWKEFITHLAPPPVASGNEIVAVTGGMFYSRETPGSAPYLEVGKHFNAGDPIYIIEVMKMFNKIHAEFSGTVEELCIDGDAGVIVKKGQPLFRVKPDVDIVVETEEAKLKRIKANTEKVLESVIRFF